MRLRHRLADGQSQAHAALAVRAPVIGCHKAIEQRILNALVDARARIADAKLNGALPLAHRQDDLAVRLRVLHRVFQQVYERLHDQLAVHGRH